MQYTRNEMGQTYNQYINKALGKLANIVAKTLFILSMFPCLHISENIVAETKFASRKKKCFPKKRHKVSYSFVFFLNVSSTRNIVFPIRHVKLLF